MSALAIGGLISGACVAMLGVMFWIAAKAPLGYETEDGFHLGEEPLADEQAWGDQ
jgi:hypothetical protein